MKTRNVEGGREMKGKMNYKITVRISLSIEEILKISNLCEFNTIEGSV